MSYLSILGIVFLLFLIPFLTGLIAEYRAPNIKHNLLEYSEMRYKIKDKVVKCTHCDTDFFEYREVQLNTAGMTLIGLDWANKTASCLTCIFCGQILWFSNKPEKYTG